MWGRGGEDVCGEGVREEGCVGRGAWGGVSGALAPSIRGGVCARAEIHRQVPRGAKRGHPHASQTHGGFDALDRRGVDALDTRRL